MNQEVKKYAETHKVLTLQINRECFNTIKNGTQKVEHRYIYPKNASRYIIVNGDQVTPRPYDALYLINGRRKDAPRMLVAVERAEFIICIDENGKDITYVEDGKEYYECQVWYHLGEVLVVE